MTLLLDLFNVSSIIVTYNNDVKIFYHFLTKTSIFGDFSRPPSLFKFKIIATIEISVVEIMGFAYSRYEFQKLWKSALCRTLLSKSFEYIRQQPSRPSRVSDLWCPSPLTRMGNH